MRRFRITLLVIACIWFFLNGYGLVEIFQEKGFLQYRDFYGIISASLLILSMIVSLGYFKERRKKK
ncbi:hypothetical protein [Myroides sp. LJL119]